MYLTNSNKDGKIDNVNMKIKNLSLLEKNIYTKYVLFLRLTVIKRN